MGRAGVESKSNARVVYAMLVTSGNVDLEEDTFSRILLGTLREHRGNLYARTAPRGHEVDHHLIDRG